MDPLSPTGTRREIITFYSYKGGTGRTMAMANVACVLAEQTGRPDAVLTVDWDLEAPGLHRFLPPRLSPQSAAIDLGLDATPGLIDLFIAVSERLPASRPDSEAAEEEAVRAAIASIDFASFIADTAVPGVSILRAGRNDDGEYSRRVNTFDWEALFDRAPSVYRAMAERLGELFQYVLIDSRTGVTDISGICTSLIPEKLVVVFTPNRQSLTGVRELIEQATSYRRNSDDLRPLLIYPLPSRIEASLQDLRTRWRLGSRSRNIVGYQPMFEELFARNYGLSDCDLSAYFDEVQIQQTPDYAYGEEIAVRRGSDRFSLANSYRVFVNRLGSGAPPWAQGDDRPVDTTADTTRIWVSSVLSSSPPAPPPLAEPPQPASAPRSAGSATVPAAGAPTSPPARPGTAASPAGPNRAAVPATATAPAPGCKVFVSCSSEDRNRIKPIVAALSAQNLRIWDLKSVPAGAQFDRAVADALDHSDVVVVCWTRNSITSEFVLAEAGEGLRRGILVPVLLDDVHPPLYFRDIQSADLRRDVEAGLKTLVEAVSRVARGTPGTQSAAAGATPPPAGPTALPRRLSPWIAAAAGIVLAVGVFGWFGTRPTGVPPPATAGTTPKAGPDSPSTGSSPPANAAPATSPSAIDLVRLPDFSGDQTAEVQKAAGWLGLQIVLRDQSGQVSPSIEGVVVNQSPAAGQQVARGSPVQLTIATLTATVPTVIGLSLDEAVLTLEKARLRIATTGERPVPDVKPGAIVAQVPVAGATAAVGSSISVTIARPVRQP